jgi:hypothetical protein
MTTTYEIPTTPEAQNFSISLAGINYNISLHWCNPASVWVIDLLDNLGNKILSGIPLVVNVDLLQSYAYLNLGGALIAQVDDSPSENPTYDNLGTVGHLYFVTP